MSGVSEARIALSTAEALREQDAAASLAAFERAVLLAAGADNRELQADAELGWGGALCSLDGRELESLPHLEHAAILGAGSNIEALSWLTMGDAFRYSKDVDRALAAYMKAAKLFQDLADLTGEVIALKARAELLLTLRRDEEALPELMGAAYLALEDEDLPEAAQLFLSLGELLLLRLNRGAEAFPSLTLAAQMFRTLGDRRLETRALIRLLATGNEPSDYSAELIRITEVMADQAAQEGDAHSEGIYRRLLAQLLEEQDDAHPKELHHLLHAQHLKDQGVSEVNRDA
jgi:hypothetical protein